MLEGWDDAAGKREVDAAAQGAGVAGRSPSPAAMQIQVQSVEAFASVHDMIHAAIVACGDRATLREIYHKSQLNGRIAYKRMGGSRVIANNDHWKSQIRHALYTGDRFARVHEKSDYWVVKREFAKKAPAMTTVYVPVDSGHEATLAADSLGTARRTKQGSRVTRSKHALETLSPAPPTRGKRSQRSKSRFMEQASTVGAFGQTEDDDGQEEGTFGQSVDATSDSAAFADSHRPGPPAMWDRSYRDMSTLKRSGLSATAVAEGEDESQNYNKGSTRVRRHFMPRAVEDTDGVSGFAGAALQGPSRAVHRLRPLGSGVEAMHGQPAGLPDDARLPCYSLGASEATDNHDRSAEAESPPTTGLYNLRSLQNSSPPGFGSHPNPVAREAAERAAVNTVGPIKSRLKAAVKAAAAVEAASQAQAEMECSGSVITVGVQAAVLGSMGRTTGSGRQRSLKASEGIESTHVTPGWSAPGLPCTPSISHPHPNVCNISSSLTTPNTLGAACSVVQPLSRKRSLDDPGLSSDEGRRVRTLRSHVAAVGTEVQGVQEAVPTRGFRPYQPPKSSPPDESSVDDLEMEDGSASPLTANKGVGVRSRRI